MNFVFVSPNFPQNYSGFCKHLRALGATVLGIGDAPYEELLPDLRDSLNEYYKVGDLADYSQMFRALAFLSFKYGKIDWLESNNEAWLESDARLREDFNIRTGPIPADMPRFKSKAEQKKYYSLAEVPTARQLRLGSAEDAIAFASKVGYPVFVKPEVGVGAAASYKLNSEEELKDFIASKPREPYVMEEFIKGDIYSYDAILDSRGEPLFESSAHFPPSMAEIAAKKLDCTYEVLDAVPAQLLERGRATAKAFGIRSRFVHFEFFKLEEAKPGLGKKGDFVGLETNMRPAGANTPDMMNFAHSTDVYRIWAEMVCLDRRAMPEEGKDHFCAYFGRRDRGAYRHGSQEALEKYSSVLAMHARVPAALSDDLGDEMFVIHAQSGSEVEEFYAFMSEKSA